MDREELIKDIFDNLSQKYEELIEEQSSIDNLREKDFLTEIDGEFRNLITQYFREREEKFRLQSEDHPDFNDNPDTPDYTVIMDEMDGTHHLIEQEGPFGPVIGLAEGHDPKFKDVLASGFLDLKNQKLYYAIKGKGAFLQHKGRTERINTSGKTEFGLGLDTKVLLQQGFLAEVPEIAEEAWKRWCNDYGSQGKHFALIASGRRDVYITGGHSKIEAKPANTAEELAGMYLLVKEAGGEIVDWSGQNVAEQKIEMNKEKNHDIVAASSKELAQKVVDQTIPEKYS